jgi:hypothetical protein
MRILLQKCGEDSCVAERVHDGSGSGAYSQWYSGYNLPCLLILRFFIFLF